MAWTAGGLSWAAGWEPAAAARGGGAGLGFQGRAGGGAIPGPDFLAQVGTCLVAHPDHP